MSWIIGGLIGWFLSNEVHEYFKKKRKAEQIAFDVLGGKSDPRLSRKKRNERT